MVHSLARQPARPARLATVAVSSEMTFVVMAMAAGAVWSHGGSRAASFFSGGYPRPTRDSRLTRARRSRRSGPAQHMGSTRLKPQALGLTSLVQAKRTKKGGQFTHLARRWSNTDLDPCCPELVHRWASGKGNHVVGLPDERESQHEPHPLVVTPRLRL